MQPPAHRAWIAPLLEREDALCMHSSGRNAAIFRQVATTVGDFELGRRSRELLNALLGGEEAWLRRTGNWFVAERPQPLERFVAIAARERVRCEPAEGAALMAVVPQLEGGADRFGVLFPEDGVMDIHEVTQAISRAATRAGAILSLEAEVTRIEVTAGRVAGVRLASAERLATGAVVIAGGAWGESLGASCGAPLSLSPLRAAPRRRGSAPLLGLPAHLHLGSRGGGRTRSAGERAVLAGRPRGGRASRLHLCRTPAPAHQRPRPGAPDRADRSSTAWLIPPPRSAVRLPGLTVAPSVEPQLEGSARAAPAPAWPDGQTCS